MALVLLPSMASSQFMRGETQLVNYRMEGGLSDYEATCFRSLHAEKLPQKLQYLVM